ncbi:MAG: hypothetical protein Q7S35_06675 [Candidatus Limnocylindrales bacterium]|nr:hypothetical protein [Candidatus Limnocylindrales bacterium]
MNRDRLVTLAVPLLAIACCLGLPILASIGASATVLVLGLGLPLALAMLLAVWVAARRHRMVRRSPAPHRRPATRHDPASDLSTRETLAHTLGDFRRRGLLESANHNVVIRGAERLTEIAEGDPTA